MLQSSAKEQNKLPLQNIPMTQSSTEMEKTNTFGKQSDTMKKEDSQAIETTSKIIFHLLKEVKVKP